MRKTLVAAGAMAGWQILLGRTTPKPDDDPFYRPPLPLPESEAGTVLRQRAAPFRMMPGIRLPVRSRQILYLSEDGQGRPIAVSGTLVTPREPRGIVSYGVGAHGLAPTCAPSYLIRLGRDPEAAAALPMLARGWAVVISDLEGSGTPGPHTYTVGASSGRALLDAARAARYLLGLLPVGILGYSEGGQSAVWAAEIQPGYAPDLPLVGVAAGGIPRDLAVTAGRCDGGSFSAVQIMAAIGQAAADPSLPFDAVLTPEGRKIVELAKTRSIAYMLARLWGRSFADFTTLKDPFGEPAWQAALAKSRCGQCTPEVPMYIYGGIFDQAVPYGETMGLAAEYAALGVDVTTRTYRLEHFATGVAGLPGAVSWLAARFAEASK